MKQRVRNWGIGLVVAGAAAATAYEHYLQQVAGQVNWRIASLLTILALWILVPLGAGLVAASLVIRAWTTGMSTTLIRRVLVAAVALVVAGVAAQLFGGDASMGVYEYMGPTGEPGAFLVSALLNIVTIVGIPLGVALGAALPAIVAVRRNDGAPTTD